MSAHHDMNGYKKLEGGHIDESLCRRRLLWTLSCGILVLGTLLVICDTSGSPMVRVQGISNEHLQLVNLASILQAGMRQYGSRASLQHSGFRPWLRLRGQHDPHRDENRLSTHGLNDEMHAQWLFGGSYGNQYRNPYSQRELFTEVDDSLERTPDMVLKEAVESVAQEEGMSETEVQERFERLTEVLGLETLETEGVKLPDVVRLAAHAPLDVTFRVVGLKTMLPHVDVSTLVARCPRLLEAEMDLSKVRKEIDAAEACTEGVPRNLLEELMTIAPRIFLMGEATWTSVWDKSSSTESNGGGKLVGECCKEARHSLGLQNDTQAVERFIKNPMLIFRMTTVSKQASND
eukprot:gnl/TRDRNA2_/TRDRNA2_80182_c0_seq1.p1 gnl/TRDRNA2_/TRDRNA2_80182_c0~~gnl/TRDRNA2_/TRDRNA2_80182_c0_seq1.p1  ORF type:complete len:348 (+),score=39.77 gnl/TRDRNA2_/TRDRNA2_80182_c0_seq1:90-1133(+)